MLASRDELEELTFSGVREFVDKIKVYEKEKEDSDSHTRLQIRYKYVGELDIVNVKD